MQTFMEYIVKAESMCSTLGDDVYKDLRNQYMLPKYYAIGDGNLGLMYNNDYVLSVKIFPCCQDRI